MSKAKLHFIILKWVRRWHRLYFENEVRVLVVMLEVYLCPPVYDGPNLTFIYTYIKRERGRDGFKTTTIFEFSCMLPEMIIEISSAKLHFARISSTCQGNV